MATESASCWYTGHSAPGSKKSSYGNQLQKAGNIPSASLATLHSLTKMVTRERNAERKKMPVSVDENGNRVLLYLHTTYAISVIMTPRAKQMTPLITAGHIALESNET